MSHFLSHMLAVGMNIEVMLCHAKAFFDHFVVRLGKGIIMFLKKCQE